MHVCIMYMYLYKCVCIHTHINRERVGENVNMTFLRYKRIWSLQKNT